MTSAAMFSIAMLAMVLAVGGVSKFNAQDPVVAESVDSVRFRIGFFAPERIKATHEVEESRKGFRHLTETVNSQGEKIKWLNHPPTPFQLELVEISSEQELQDKIGSLHFLVGAGGLDRNASELEARVASEHKTVLVRCCSIWTTEEPPIDDDDRHIFDVRPDSKTYVEALFQALIGQPVTRVAVVVVEKEEEDSFHANVCGDVLSMVFAAFDIGPGEEGDGRLKCSLLERSEDIAKGISFCTSNIKAGYEAVFACLPEEYGEELIKALDREKYPVKALYLSDGPENPQWREKMGDLAVGVFSATQLVESNTFRLTDVFGTTSKYISGMQESFGKNYTPSSTAAASSTSAYLLAESVREAFSHCNPVGDSPINANDLLKSNTSLECRNENGEVTGSSLIVNYLMTKSFITIAGNVTFGKNGKNTQEAFTIQVDENKEANIVLPVAQHALKYPAKNRYQSECKKGEVFSEEDYYQPCKPCPAGSYSNTTNAETCIPCSIGFYGDKEGMDKCLKCPRHTTTMEGSTSALNCQCVNGYFNHTTCDAEGCCECPDGSRCPGGSQLPIPKAGFWRDEDTVDVYKCYLPSSCLGDKCAPGRNGTLCYQCEKGHFKLGEACEKCFGKVEFSLMLFLLYLTWYVANMVISNSVTSLGMLLSFTQLSNAIGGVDLNWPSKITITFGITNILSFDLDILWPTCVFPNWSFAENFYVQMLFPLTMGLMALFGYFLSTIAWSFAEGKNIDRRSRTLRWCRYIISVPLTEKELSEKWDSTIAASLSAIEVSYITIARHLFRVFNCVKIAGDRVLSASPDMLCDSPEHKVLVAASIVGIIFYLLGFMAFVSIKLFKMRRLRSFALPQNIRRYGFLYTQFEPGYVWMSVLSLARRLAFVAVWVFMDSPAFQATALAVLSTSSLMIHVYSAPYVDTYLDVLFSFLLVALMFETFGGLLFFSENLPEGDRKVMEWVVMSVIILVVLVFVIIFAIELKRKYYVRVLRRMHVDAVLRATSSDIGSSGRREGLRNKTEASEVSADLITTFQPEFLYNGLRGWDEGFLDFDYLTDKLQAFMSDESETSYLSTKNVAKFWRNLVEKFPELIDFLAIADESTRSNFVEFAKSLYTDYFLKKRVDSLQIHKVLDWRDMAPIAQWLSLCPESDRQFFTVFVANFFHRAGGEDEFDEFAQGITESGSSWFHPDFVQSSMSSLSMPSDGLKITPREIPSRARSQPRRMTAKRALWIMKSYREISIRQEIQSGAGPLFHPAAPQASLYSTDNSGSLNLNKISEDGESKSSNSCDLGLDEESMPLLENGGEDKSGFPESPSREVTRDPVDGSIGQRKDTSISIPMDEIGDEGDSQA